MRWILVLIAVFLSAVDCLAETRVFETTRDGKVRRDTVAVTETAEAGGWRILSISDEGRSRVDALVNASGQVQTYNLVSAQGHCVFNCDSQWVSVKGTWRGKPREGRADHHGLGFYGPDFDLGLRAFAASKKDRLLFPMLSLDDPQISLYEMEIVRLGSATFQGHEAVRVRIGLTGLLALIWNTEVLIDSQGRQLEWRGTTGPGTSFQVQRLLEIRP